MTRRGRGEGSIRKRAPNRYEARFVGADGRRHSLYARSRPEAVAKLTSALRDLNLGIFVTGERQTVAQYLDAWLTDAARTRKPRTMQRYTQLVRQHAAAIGAIELRRLTPQHIASLYSALAALRAIEQRASAPADGESPIRASNRQDGEGDESPAAVRRDSTNTGTRGGSVKPTLSPSSIAQLHAVLHGALEQAVRWNLIPRNPAAAVKGPKVTKPDITPLTAEQVRTLLTAVQGDPLEALYVLAVTTGMRSGELLGLQWQDVDLEAGRVQVRRTLYWMQGWQLGTPKTAASIRSIALTESAVAALRSHRRRQAEELLGISIRIGPESQVFTDRWGNPINGFHLTERLFKPLLRRADLPMIRFHDLRHSAATLMLANGVNPKVVAEMLGHSSVTTTLNTYAHVLPTMQEDAARRLDSVLRGAG